MATQQSIRTVNIKGKLYVDVAERVRLCNDDQGFSMINQEHYQIGERYFFRVMIEVKGKCYYGDAEIKFDARPGTPDATNPIECAQTSAMGRALGFAGYGSLESIASADEVVRAQQEQGQGSTTQMTDKTRASIEQSAQKLRKRAESAKINFEEVLKELGISEISTGQHLSAVSKHLTALGVAA